MWTEEGFLSFYRGYDALFCRYTIYSGAWWTTYEIMKGKLLEKFLLHNNQKQHKQQKEQTNSKKESKVIFNTRKKSQLLAGAFAGAVAVILSNPIAVVQTRLQTQHHLMKTNVYGDVQMNLYRNTFHALWTIVRKENSTALLKGIIPRLLISCTFSPLASITYEFILKQSRNQRSN